jgi:hypothetical protein
MSSLFGPHCGGHGLTADELECATKVLDMQESREQERVEKVLESYVLCVVCYELIRVKSFLQFQ